MEPEALSAIDADRQTALFERDSGIGEIRSDAREIVDQVRADGDDALRTFARRYDDVAIDAIEITDRAAAAADTIDDDARAAIETAIANVEAFHERQVPEDWDIDRDGARLGRRYHPLEAAGVYAPGGTAAYPSSAIMGIVPARVAGVDRIAVATPPAEQINPVTLAAIDAAGADEVYQMGGAQAIGALAYGTETVDPVDVVVGPGNRWVTAAKEYVRGDVNIDMLAGPSEVIVVADETADPDRIAVEMLAQAEHDPNAACVAVITDDEVAERSVERMEARLPDRDRAEIIRDALANDSSGVFVAASMADAIEFANEYAGEHIYVETSDPEATIAEISNYGSAFLGPYTPVAAGDYASGTNHVLPTGGTAALQAGLSVDEFVRSATVQYLEREGLADLRETITTLADREGLEAHAASVEARFED
ncbi:MAG: histidinol dehydrogenase [Halococcoides sp.]